MLYNFYKLKEKKDFFIFFIGDFVKLSGVVYEPATSVCCQKIPCIFCSQRYVFTHSSSSLKWHASYEDDSELRSCLCESRGGCPGLPVPNSL